MTFAVDDKADLRQPIRDGGGATVAKGPFTPSASTSVYADMEHMGKGMRVHTERVYVRRRRAQNRTVLDFERVDVRRRT